jgi:hypothetical protein
MKYQRPFFGLLFFMFIILQNSLFSQWHSDYSENALYTLNDGDYWVYELYMQYDVLIDIETKTIISDTTLPNQITYKKILNQNLYVTHFYYYTYERVDTNENIYYYSFDNTLPLDQRDQLYLKLNVEVGDTFKTDIWDVDGYWLVEDIWYDSLGRNILYYWDYLTQTHLYFNEMVGIYAGYYEGGSVRKLRGAYINGMLIGDTSTVKTNNYLNDERIPQEYNYICNYPNPFNIQTTITYTISRDSNISLSIYNIGGKLIKTLISSFQESGKYRIYWDGLDDSGNFCSAGIYLIHLKTDYGLFTNKMILLK